MDRLTLISLAIMAFCAVLVIGAYISIVVA